MLDFHATAGCRTTEALGRLQEDLDAARRRNAGLLARNGALIEERTALERKVANRDEVIDHLNRIVDRQKGLLVDYCRRLEASQDAYRALERDHEQALLRLVGRPRP